MLESVGRKEIPSCPVALCTLGHSLVPGAWEGWHCTARGSSLRWWPHGVGGWGGVCTLHVDLHRQAAEAIDPLEESDGLL